MTTIPENLSIISEYPQDTIVFSLTDEEPMANDTVRIQVEVAAMITEDAESKTRDNILESLNRFVKPDKKEGKNGGGWNLSNIRRATANNGVEELTLMATIRVPESQNVSSLLQSRAEKISKAGLRLNRPTADQTVPLSKREEALRRLRTTLINTAYEQCQEITKSTRRTYRVAKIDFTEASSSSSSNRSMSSYSNRAAGASGEDGEGFTSTEKAILTADVTLAASITDTPKQ